MRIPAFALLAVLFALPASAEPRAAREAREPEIAGICRGKADRAALGTRYGCAEIAADFIRLRGVSGVHDAVMIFHDQHEFVEGSVGIALSPGVQPNTLPKPVVIVTKGLPLLAGEDRSAIAFILAHELAHLAAKDPLEYGVRGAEHEKYLESWVAKNSGRFKTEAEALDLHKKDPEAQAKAKELADFKKVREKAADGNGLNSMGNVKDESGAPIFERQGAWRAMERAKGFVEQSQRRARAEGWRPGPQHLHASHDPFEERVRYLKEWADKMDRVHRVGAGLGGLGELGGCDARLQSCR